MFRNLFYAVQDFFAYDVPDFIDRINVIGRMRDAEAEAAVLFFENKMLLSTLNYGASQYLETLTALKEISAAAHKVKRPNGTTVKLGRIADECLAGLLTVQVEKALAEQAAGA